MIPVDLHIRPDADAVVVGKKLVGQLHHQRFVLSFGKAEVLNHRFPVSFVINHLQKRKNGAGRRWLSHVHIDTGIGGEEPSIQKEKDAVGAGQIS